MTLHVTFRPQRPHQPGVPHLPFAAAMTAQHAVCARDLAPRQREMPDFAGALNYGYHLDAGKFAALLARHATGRLGVTRVPARVSGVERAADGTIAAICLDDRPALRGDLFIDCSGMSGLLIAGECGAGWIDRSDVSFNDRALAVQVPVAPMAPIAAQTVGTAHEAGWLWDIALPTRRGIGCVYSVRHLADERAVGATVLAGLSGGEHHDEHRQHHGHAEGHEEEQEQAAPRRRRAGGRR